MDYQTELAHWHHKNFPDATPEDCFVVLAEEVGELARTIAKPKYNIRGTKEEWLAESYKELGDVMLCLYSVAESLGISLDDAVRDRWKVIKERDWTMDRVQHGLPE